MGLFTRLKQAFRKEPAPAPRPVPRASTSQITATTTDYLVRNSIEKIEPAIRTGFEKLGTLLIDEIRASERRTIEYFEGAFSNRPLGAARRITKEDVLEQFDRAQIRKLQDLKAALKANSSAIINHLKKLEKEGAVERTGYGEYKKIEREFKENKKVHGEVAKNIKGLEQANSAEEGLRYLFKSA